MGIKVYSVCFHLQITYSGSLNYCISSVIANEAKWQDKIAELQKKVNEAEVKSKETNIVIQEKIVTNTKIIKEKGKDIVSYIDREIVKKEEIIKYIEQCPVPKEIINLHNQAAELNKVEEGKK